MFKKILLTFSLLLSTALGQSIQNTQSAGITNSAGNNVISKSNGTNLVASALSDNGTNVTSTESEFLPNGTGALPAYSWTNETNSGLYRNASGDFRYSVAGNDITRTDSTGFSLAGGTILQWGSTGAVTSRDTGLSRGAAGEVDCGNGAQGDTTCAFKLGKITSYNAVATVDSGVPSEVGVAGRDQTGLTGALSATTICTPSATGRFRISVYEKVTTAASVSSILGGASGTVLTYTDGTDSVAQSITMGLDSQGGTVALTNSGNSTTTSLNGAAFIYAKTGVAIQLAVGYTSSGTAMAYQVRASCEAL